MSTVKGFDLDGSLVAQRDASGEFDHSGDQPKLAHEISVVLRRGKGQQRYSFVIDGQEFPWLISDDGVRVVTSGNTIPSVTVTIYADSVKVIDEFVDG